MTNQAEYPSDGVVTWDLWQQWRNETANPDGTVNDLGIARKAADWAREQSWIPVRERLPLIEDWYAVKFIEIGCEPGLPPKVAFFENAKNWDVDSDEQVTHWYPLPAPPTTQEQP